MVFMEIVNVLPLKSHTCITDQWKTSSKFLNCENFPYINSIATLQWNITVGSNEIAKSFSVKYLPLYNLQILFFEEGHTYIHKQRDFYQSLNATYIHKISSLKIWHII